MMNTSNNKDGVILPKEFNYLILVTFLNLVKQEFYSFILPVRIGVHKDLDNLKFTIYQYSSPTTLQVVRSISVSALESFPPILRSVLKVLNENTSNQVTNVKLEMLKDSYTNYDFNTG